MSEPTQDRAKIMAPPPLLFAACLAVGLLLGWLWPLKLTDCLGAARLIAGLALLAASGAAAVPAMFAFRRRRTPVDPGRGTSFLVAEGPFRHTRNPMYLGLVLIMAALFCLSASLWMLLAGLTLYLLLLHGVIKPEERYLENKFGEPYLAYKSRVRRWL